MRASQEGVKIVIGLAVLSEQKGKPAHVEAVAVAGFFSIQQYAPL